MAQSLKYKGPAVGRNAGKVWPVVVETRQLAVPGTSHAEENINDIGLEKKLILLQLEFDLKALFVIEWKSDNFLVRKTVNVVENTGQVDISLCWLEKPVELAG